MITASQILAHLIGDYILQSDWMAANKRLRSVPCAIHCLLYTACFVPITQNWISIGIIFASHFAIDRFGLARYIVYLKNALSPEPMPAWEDCNTTGYHHERPAWLATWLTIIADNTLHLICNGLAIWIL